MRILHVIFSLQTGGTEAMLVDIINHQIEHAKVALFVINNEVNNALLGKINKKVEVKFMKRVPGSKSPLAIFKLNLNLLKYKPDVIHCHNHKTINSLFLFSKKTLVTTHTTGIPGQNLKKYVKLYAISEAVAKDVHGRTGLNPTVISNGIPVGEIEFKKDYSFNDFKILQVGRLRHEEKGQHIALGALKKLKDMVNINVTLDLIGEGESLQYLEQLTDSLNLKKQVSFLGLKDRRYIYQHLKNYDLLMQPSFYEGFGLTIAEAMAAKVPVLVSNIEGPMEVIKNGEVGNYFEKGNISNAAEQIKGIIMQNSSEKEMITEKAYNHVVEKYKIQNTSLQYLLEYKKIC